jgi:hypothetical protein
VVLALPDARVTELAIDEDGVVGSPNARRLPKKFILSVSVRTGSIAPQLLTRAA